MKQRLPIYFNQNFYIEGRDSATGAPNFMLKVFIGGRCLLTEEAPEEMGARWWLYGVNPSGVAGSGATDEEARLDFYDRVQSILIDLADESQSLEEFKTSVERFVAQTSDIELQDWNLAREEVRAGRADAVGYRRVTTDEAPKCSVDAFVDQSGDRKVSVENASFGPIPVSAANDRFELATAA